MKNREVVMYQHYGNSLHLFKALESYLAERSRSKTLVVSRTRKDGRGLEQARIFVGSILVAVGLKLQGHRQLNLS